MISLAEITKSSSSLLVVTKGDGCSKVGFPAPSFYSSPLAPLPPLKLLLIELAESSSSFLLVLDYELLILYSGIWLLSVYSSIICLTRSYLRFFSFSSTRSSLSSALLFSLLPSFPIIPVTTPAIDELYATSLSCGYLSSISNSWMRCTISREFVR